MSLRTIETESSAQKIASVRGPPYSKYFREVAAVSDENDFFKIDAVSWCEENKYLIGWEYKRSHLFKSEYAAALRQAIHYRMSRLNDDRLPEFKGRQVHAVFVFPDWLGEHDDKHPNYGKEADGMRLLASHFRVGTMRILNDNRAKIIMGETAIWNSDTGWSSNASGILLGKRSLAAKRRKDN